MPNVKKHWLSLIPAVLLLCADQWLKHWILTTLPLYSSHALWPGVVELTYVQNTGAAFSLFSDHTWLLALISAAAALAMLFLLLRDYFPHLWGRLSLSLVLGGALGNLVDRVMLGYVVDMFSLQFMDFAIFNIADIAVTMGGLAFCLYLVFTWNKEEKPPTRDVDKEIQEAIARAQKEDTV